MTSRRDAATRAYVEAKVMLADPAMASVVKHGFTILYGPPIQSPDLFLISFQGGGAAPVDHGTWLERLLYIDDEHKPGNAFKFGRSHCRYAREAGLYTTLQRSTVAVPAVFPGGPEREAGRWLVRNGPRARWREFSVGWVKRFVDAFRPKVIAVFGDKTAQALGLDGTWRDVSHKHGQGWMTCGLNEWRGVPTVYTTHLSRPVRHEAVRALLTARELIG
jgi:hypothetical protein